jgi:ribonucleoside-triphosphate reductase
MYVIKRDGTRVLFDINKIVNAINKAMIHVDGSLYETETAEEIADIIASEGKDMTVEHIQDRVEEELMKSSRPDVAKAYILYRDQRTKERDRNSKLIKTVMRRTEATAVENANANVDENSFSGREKEASADIQKIIALDYTLSPKVANAHKSMLLYQHDLEKTNIGEHNCLFVDFKKLFTEGFVTRNGGIRPPSTFSTACQQYAVIFQCQSQVQFGGVGTVHLDYDLAPFVKKSFRKHVKNYFTDVQYYSDEKALEIMEEFEKSCGEICIDNLEMQSQYGYPDAYNYAMKQLEREGRQSAEALFHNLNNNFYILFREIL